MEWIESDDNAQIPADGAVAYGYKFYVFGDGVDPTIDEVNNFIESNIPRTKGPNNDLRLSGINPRRVGPGLYEVDAQYSRLIRKISGVPPIDANTGPNSYAFSFNTTGGNYHTKVAKSQTSFGTAPASVGLAINWNGQSADGVDIVGPKLQFEIRKKKAGNLITLAYIRTLVGMTGKTNNATFLGFAAGELLFLGASGQQVSGGDTEITFQFAAAPNLASASINGETVTDIKGHDYVWSFVTPGALNVPVVQGVYRATLYDSGDFTTLGAT